MSFRLGFAPQGGINGKIFGPTKHSRHILIYFYVTLAKLLIIFSHKIESFVKALSSFYFSFLMFDFRATSKSSRFWQFPNAIQTGFSATKRVCCTWPGSGTGFGNFLYGFSYLGLLNLETYQWIGFTFYQQYWREMSERFDERYVGCRLFSCF